MVRPRTQRAGIKDVARAAGVSKTAVSFAFNQPDQLSRATKARILEVATDLGYRPHPVARMLARRRTMSIGVLIPQPLSATFGNPYFGRFSEGVAKVAEGSGYELHFLSPDRGSLARTIDRTTVDGLIVVGLPADHAEIDRLAAADIPVVLVDSTAIEGLPSIRVDDEGGAHAAATHLLSLGHRDVMVLAVEPSRYPPGDEQGVGPDRLRGYIRAFRDQGRAFPAGLLCHARSTIEAGATAFRDRWSAGLRPTAVLAMSDALAIGAMSAARGLGIGVPDDLSVVGFDDIEIAAHTDPPLTTIHQPIRAKGEAAMSALQAEMEDRVVGTRPARRLATHLVVRGSTGPRSRRRARRTSHPRVE
jgi:alanine racemase